LWKGYRSVRVEREFPDSEEGFSEKIDETVVDITGQ
jgi:hypothetical protein